MRNFFILMVMLFTPIGCQSQTTFSIKPFIVLNRVDTTKEVKGGYTMKLEAFLINDYKDDANFENYLLKYTEKHKASDFSKYANYLMVFYKKSERTNLEGNPNTTDIEKKYSNIEDLVREYIWSYGRLISKHKLKNGQYIIESNNNIVLKDTK